MGTKNEIVYDLRHFERDFNGTEQVNGLELALAEPKKDIRIKMLANEQREAGIPYVSGDNPVLFESSHFSFRKNAGVLHNVVNK